MPDSGTIFPPAFRVVTEGIAAVAGGSLEFYASGTTTPLTVYSNDALSTSLGSIVYLDSGGHPVSAQGGSTKVSIFTGASLYKVVVKSAAGVTLATYDGQRAAQDTSGTAGSGSMTLPVDEMAVSSLTITSTDYGELKEIDVTSSSCTVALPLALDAGSGTIVGIKRKSSANSLTIVAVGSDQVAGAGSLSLAADGDAVMLASNGTDEWKLWSFARPSLASGAITSDLLDGRVVGGLAAVGDIKMLSTGTVPSGWLECNGAAVSRTTYAALFAVIGETWGEGDNATTFNLPDLRGRVPRGWDHGASRDPDKASRTASATGGATGDNVGSVQDDAMKAHRHFSTADAASTSALTNSNYPAKSGNVGSADQQYLVAGSNNDPTLGLTSEQGTSTETRGKNAYVMFIIMANPAAAAGGASVVNTIYSTSGTPSSGVGINGDFAIDSSAKVLYGPKAAGAWPSGVSLAGTPVNAFVTLTLANGANNDVTLPSGVNFRVSGPTGAFSLSGLTGGVDGREIRIHNPIAQNLTLTNDNGSSSTAANRIYTMTGSDVATTGIGVASFVYSGTDSRWILTGMQT